MHGSFLKFKYKNMNLLKYKKYFLFFLLIFCIGFFYYYFFIKDKQKEMKAIGCGYYTDNINIYFTANPTIICYTGKIKNCYKIKNADVKPFTCIDFQRGLPLGRVYGKDNKNIFYLDNVIPEADRASFAILDTPKNNNDTYSKDNRNVYFAGQKIVGADPLTFLILDTGILGTGYSKDKNNVYYRDKIIPRADTSTFNVATEYEEGRYYDAWDKNNRYEDGESYKEVLGCSYSKKDNKIFYHDKVVVNADYSTFKVYSEQHEREDCVEGGLDRYALDKNHIFYKGDIIPGVDLTTFTFLVTNEYFSYSSDKNNVYRDGKLIPGADPTTFELLAYKNQQNQLVYSKDKNHVFRDDEVISGADPKTFIIISQDFSSIYAKDKNNVYHDGVIISGADADTFNFVDSSREYMKDKNRVYYIVDYYRGIGEGVVVKDADPHKFKSINNEYFQDEKNIFYKGKKIDTFDYNSFQFLSNYYVKDKNNIYCSGKLLENVDYKSFTVIPAVEVEGMMGGNVKCDGLAKDKNNIYDYCKIVDNYTPGQLDPDKIGKPDVRDFDPVVYCNHKAADW
jgi:hypothetical protein